GILLQRPDAQKMACPVRITVDMAEHDGCSASQARAMRRAHYFQPTASADFVWAQDGADIVIENFRRRSGKRPKAAHFELLEEFFNCNAERCSALLDFQGRKRVNVNVGRGAFHGATDAEVCLAGIAWMNSALHAYFGGATRPGFCDALLDFTQRKIVRAAAQVLAHFAFGKGAEPAFEIADIGVVEIARHDI